MTLRRLIEYAYGVHDEQILGAAKWVDSRAYDIDAKIADSAAPLRLRQEQYNSMFLVLLQDRFQLKVHWETRVLPVLMLVVAKGGPKLDPAKPHPNGILEDRIGDPNSNGSLGWSKGRLTGLNIPVSSLVPALTDQTGHIVQDKTGIRGTYDIHLHWADNGTGDSRAASDPSRPSLYTAIQEQLGLKLQPGKARLPVLVIDHAAPPAEN